MSSKAFTGGCACGAVRYEVASEPLMAGHCQCRECQRSSGTGHTSHMAFPRAAAKVSGTATTWKRSAETGHVVSQAFCPACGSPVYSTNDGMPDLLFVRAASLDEPDRFQPQMIVWSQSGYAWDQTDPALPKFDKMPPM